MTIVYSNVSQKVQKVISSIYIILLCLSFWIFLWLNRHHNQVPNPDIFQYIYEGSYYLKGLFPPSIHAPPFSPFFINLLSVVFQHHPHPEILSANLLNITAASTNLAIIFLVLKSISPLLAHTIPLLLATNKLYFLYGINVTNEMVYCLFFSLVILAYQQQKNRLAYLIAGLSFFVRYEALVLIIGLVVIDLYQKVNLSTIVRRLFFSFTPIMIWLSVLATHSTGSGLSQNAYLVEIANGLNNLPNWRSFITLVELIITTLPTRADTSPLFLHTISLILFMHFTKHGTPSTIRLAYLSGLLHLFFLTLFPNFALRYSIPVLWIVYLVILNHNNHLVQTTLIIALLIVNLKQLPQTPIYDENNNNSEHRLVANWLTSQPFSNKAHIITYQPWITQYYTRNSSVFFAYDNQPDYSLAQYLTDCDHIMSCVTYKISYIYPQSDIFVITTSTSSKILYNHDDQFTAGLHLIDTFQKFSSSTDINNHFQLITTLSDESNWAKIYHYNPQKTTAQK